MQNINFDNVDNIFVCKYPNDDQINRCKKIVERANLLVKTILTHVPVGSDQQTAIHKIRGAVIITCTAIALENLGTI